MKRRRRMDEEAAYTVHGGGWRYKEEASYKEDGGGIRG
jgi:hypothetical protein